MDADRDEELVTSWEKYCESSASELREPCYKTPLRKRAKRRDYVYCVLSFLQLKENEHARFLSIPKTISQFIFGNVTNCVEFVIFPKGFFQEIKPITGGTRDL